MWFDIIKDNKRTQYYREFLEDARKLGDLIDSPDNIKAYENFTGDERPEYGDRAVGILYSHNFMFFCGASIQQTMVISKYGSIGEHPSTIAPGDNKQYNDFSVRMFKNEYPELYNKIWEFALFYNKIVNPNLLGKEADKQKELFRSSSKSDNSMELLKTNLGIIYKFIEEFLFSVRDMMLVRHPEIVRLQGPEVGTLHLGYDPLDTIIFKNEFINKMASYPKIENAYHTSNSFTLRTSLNRVAAHDRLTTYILEQWITIINLLTYERRKQGNPNIKNVQLLKDWPRPAGTVIYNDWFNFHHDEYIEELKIIVQRQNTPEEDLGNWEDDDDDDDEVNALFV